MQELPQQKQEWERSGLMEWKANMRQRSISVLEQTVQPENNGPEQMSMNNVKMSRKKLMQREFAEAAAQKQRKEAANGAGSIGKKFTDKAGGSGRETCGMDQRVCC